MLTELPLEGGIVERGTPVTIIAEFDDDPQKGVFVSFMRPQEGRAIIDPGYGSDGSRVQRFGRGGYSYVIDTTGFKQGRVWWHIWATENASKFGWFDVRSDAPAQLL